MPLVSLITPTFQRSAFLRLAARTVSALRHPDLEWLVLDDSPEPDPWLGARASVGGVPLTYLHARQRLTTGEKRNRLCERARGEIVAHLDDDDWYAPDYLTTMLGLLGDAELVKLSSFFLYTAVHQAFGYWDTTSPMGHHYTWTKAGRGHVVVDERNVAGLLDMHLGWGFSYVYRRSAWARNPFPDVRWNEDTPFAKAIEARGGFRHIPDQRGLCLHVLHRTNTSKCFPQHELPTFLAERLFGPDGMAVARLAEGGSR